jgi:hypothetical protein
MNSSKKYIVDIVRASATIHSERGLYIKNIVEPSPYPVNLRHAPPEYLFDNQWYPQSDIYLLGMHILTNAGVSMQYEEIIQQASKSKREIPIIVDIGRAHYVTMELLQLALGNADCPRKFSKRYKSNPIVIPGELRAFLQQLLHWDYRKRGEFGFASVYYHPYLEQDIADDTYRPMPPMESMKTMDLPEFPLESIISGIINPLESIDKKVAIQSLPYLYDDNVSLIKLLAGYCALKSIPWNGEISEIFRIFPEYVRIRPIDDIARFMSIKISAPMQEIAAQVNLARAAMGLDVLNIIYTSTYDIYYQVLCLMVPGNTVEHLGDAQELRNYYLSEVALAWNTPISIAHILEEIETDANYRLSDYSYDWDRINKDLLSVVEMIGAVDGLSLLEQTEYLHDVAHFIQNPMESPLFGDPLPDPAGQEQEEEPVVEVIPSEKCLESTTPPE